MIHRTLPLVLACFLAHPVLAAEGAADPEPRWALGVGISVADGAADPSRNPPTLSWAGGGYVNAIASSSGLEGMLTRDSQLVDLAGPDLAVGLEARLGEAWWLPISAVVWSWNDDTRGATLSTGLRRMWQSGPVRPSVHLNLGVGIGRTWGDVDTRQFLGAVGGAVDVPLMGPLWLRGSIDAVSFRREWWGDTTDYTGFSLLPATRLALWTRF